MKTVSPLEVAKTIIIVLAITNVIACMAYLELIAILKWYKKHYMAAPRLQPAPPPGRLQQIVCFVFQIRF